MTIKEYKITEFTNGIEAKIYNSPSTRVAIFDSSLEDIEKLQPLFQEQFDQAGVYIFRKEDQIIDMYIGQTDCFTRRLKQHFQKGKKEDFEFITFITSLSSFNQLNKSDLLYIESKLIKELSSFKNKIRVTNGNEGSIKEIDNLTKIKLQADIEEIKKGLYLLGLDFFNDVVEEEQFLSRLPNKETLDDFIEVSIDFRKGSNFEGKIYFSPSLKKIKISSNSTFKSTAIPIVRDRLSYVFNRLSNENKIDLSIDDLFNFDISIKEDVLLSPSIAGELFKGHIVKPYVMFYIKSNKRPIESFVNKQK